MQVRILAMLALVMIMAPVAWAAESIQPGETLDMQRCIAIALERHPSILGSAGSLRASQSKVGQAQASYYPQVSWSNTADRIHPTGGAGVLSGDTNYTKYQSDVSLNQTLYDFGKTSSQVKVQALSADAARADFANTTSQIVYGVKEAYFGVLKARQNREAYAQAVAQFEQHLDSAKRSFEVGVKSKIDVTKAEVDLSQARLNLITAENALKIARLSLLNAMGVPDAPAFEIRDASSAIAVPPTLDEALTRGYAHRADLASASARRAAAERSIALARTGYYPVLSGNAGYGWSGQDFPLEKEWTFGAGLSFPLFNGFLTRYQIDEARANLDTAKANEVLVKQTVRYDVSQAFANLSDAKERIALGEVTVRQARENRELAEGRYSAGVGNALEVTDALVSEINAKTSYISAVYDYQIALASLAKAMGENE